VSGVLRLAWRHARHHWGRSLILIACLGVALMLPLAVERLVSYYEATLSGRAEATPLVVGAKGNRFDLVLRSLYFDTAYADGISMADVAPIEQRGFGRAIPLHVRYTAHRLDETGDAADAFASAPVVGTTLAYFEFRDLEVAEGTMPLFLGDAVVGAEVARRLGVGPSNALLSDPVSAHNPARSFQLKLPVVGVLAPANTPDDHAIFVDLKSAWVLDGIGHGHEDLRIVGPDGVVDRARSTERNLVATARLARYQEITPENRASFHFHGDRSTFPLTSILLVPADDRARTMALGWYNLSETRQLLVPAEVVRELMGLVFQVKRFFDANAIVVGATTGLLVALVLLLSYRLRRPEMATLAKIGAGRGAMVALQAAEIAMLLAASVAIALLGTWLSVHAAPLVFTTLPT
jgi:putative ABC transport system permease protein